MDDAEYRALREKVDAFAGAVAGRADLACRVACSACCQVDLELSEIEAWVLAAALARLPAARRRQLRERPPSDACALLDDDGRCACYEARPLVCRTQGLPLRYPRGTVPADALRARAAGADVTWCPLNFAGEPPQADDVLDAGRVDLMLALVNRRAAGEARALHRRSIRDLLEEATR